MTALLETATAPLEAAYGALETVTAGFEKMTALLGTVTESVEVMTAAPVWTATHRGRADGPARPTIPGVFLTRHRGCLLTYFDELNAVLRELIILSSTQKSKEMRHKNAFYFSSIRG